MGITAIKRVLNRSSQNISLVNLENSATDVRDLPPGASREVSLFIPWATDANQFVRQRLELRYGSQTRYWIWQAGQADGDFVRFSTKGSWQNPGLRAHGIAAVDGDRTLVVQDDGFELHSLPDEVLTALRSLLGSGGYRLSWQRGERADVPSVPRYSAQAFSVAGPSSDGFERGEANSRFRFNDSGKRYRFVLRSGVVVAIHPDGRETPLTQAVSYNGRRAGQTFTAPTFDLIAANGGRVIAKEQGTERMFFALMDQMFVHLGEQDREIVVPSTYFKNDPEFNQPGARVEDLVLPLTGNFADHPAAERFPLYRLGLEQGLVDMMVVSVRPRVWHQIDVRPPLGQFNPMMLGLQLARNLASTHPLLKNLLPAIEEALAQARVDDTTARQLPGTPGYLHASYARGADTVHADSIDFTRVLDIGVGHVHVHEQYERVMGGEIQPLRTPSLIPFPNWPRVGYAELYRFANGPISDGDGYIDGTCNFYALVELRGGGYALLYMDEQSYFTQRWRLADPSDFRGMATALVKGMEEQPAFFGWDKTRFWSPFQTGNITATSRMAVSRQVVLLTGVDRTTASPTGGEPRIYSINFSYSSMDHSWRWRRLPEGVTAAEIADVTQLANESIPSTANRVYPQTLRLREDMTLHLKGTVAGPGGASIPGRWYQRYLPASNDLVPPPSELMGSTPARGYTHPWKFISEAAFQSADTFSHLGVYGTVDSRTQYYSVTPVSAADAQVLREAENDPAPWCDTGYQIFVRALKFWWSAPAHIRLLELGTITQPVVIPKRTPPSLFNRQTMLRIVERAGRFIALHWDKRDDELVPFELPVTVELTKGARRAKVTLTANTWIEQTPAARRVEMAWSGNPNEELAMTLFGAQRVTRVRMAALEQGPDATNPHRQPRVVMLFDRAFNVNIAADASSTFHWMPTPAERALLAQYCSPAGARDKGTSIWFEDIVGHVGVPDEIVWQRTMTTSIAPSALPIGVPTQIIVRAIDTGTLQPVPGYVSVNGTRVGATNAPITATFRWRTERVFDPQTRAWLPQLREPDVTVEADAYKPSVVEGADYYEPSLRLWVEPASLPLSRHVQFTVRAQDSQTGAAIIGRVIINGSDVGALNTTIAHTFASRPQSGLATSQYYRSASIPWPAFYMPVLSVSVTPSPVPMNRATSVTVRATDQATGAPVAGRVWIDGVDVAATNVAFTHLFRIRRVGRPPNIELTMPTGTVKAPGYADVDISFI